MWGVSYVCYVCAAALTLAGVVGQIVAKVTSTRRSLLKREDLDMKSHRILRTGIQQRLIRYGLGECTPWFYRLFITAKLVRYKVVLSW